MTIAVPAFPRPVLRDRKMQAVAMKKNPSANPVQGMDVLKGADRSPFIMMMGTIVDDE